jgi:hypothetical protein
MLNNLWRITREAAREAVKVYFRPFVVVYRWCFPKPANFSFTSDPMSPASKDAPVIGLAEPGFAVAGQGD